MTIKEARYIIQNKFNYEEDYYREFGEYSTDHSADMQKALDIALDMFDVVDILDNITMIMDKYSTPINLHNTIV